MEQKPDIVVYYGGRFSPPTHGHKDCVLAAYSKLHNIYPNKYIHLVFVPTNKYFGSPSMGENCVSEQDRVKMVELMVENLNSLQLPFIKFFISDIEQKYGKKNKSFMPTYSGVETIQRKYGIAASTIFIILPQYNYEELLNGIWIKSEKLLENYNFIILPKNETIVYKTELEEELLDSFDRDAAKLEINKSPEGVPLRKRTVFIDSGYRYSNPPAVRRAIFDGSADLDRITIREVADYIRTKKLYKKKSCLPFYGRKEQRKGRKTRKVGNAKN